MVLQGVGNFVTYPDYASVLGFTVASGYPLFSTSDNYRLDSTRTKQAMILTVPKSGNITAIAFALQAAASDQQLRVGVYAVDASGLPDTATAYKTMAVGDDATTLATGAILEITLGTQCTSAVVGDVVAVVFEWTSTEGDIRFAVLANSTRTPAFANCARYASATWTADKGRTPMVAFKYDDGTYASANPICYNVTARTYKADTAGADEYGLKVVLPFKARLVGAYCAGSMASSSTNLNLTVYSGTDSIATGAFDPDLAPSPPAMCAVWFATPVELAAGTYYVSCNTTSTTASAISLNCATVTANAQFATWPGGTACYQAKRLDAGAWSEVTTEYTPIGLILDQLDDGLDGSSPTVTGILIQDGMNGGMNG